MIMTIQKIILTKVLSQPLSSSKMTISLILALFKCSEIKRLLAKVAKNDKIQNLNSHESGTSDLELVIWN